MGCGCDAGQDYTLRTVEGMASRGTSFQTHESLLLFTYHFWKRLIDIIEFL
ncbi:hypothetical protein Syun_026174 [Stephania yunnanensis]|uniref:Uncharacterized protein n=1 Tax=Stephania yunnanensis TaxID=152371 RepID=A0AAP0F1W8_9MAGN